MRTTRVLLTLAVATLAAACLDPAYEAGAGSVTGGAADRTRTWVGRLTQGGWTCSASLIEPRVVLTAKHCLAEGIAPSSVSFLASTGTRADTVVAKAIGLHYTGAIDVARGVPSDDFAAIALDRPVTVVAAGPRASTTAIDRLEGENVVLVGFGGTTDDGASGTRLSGSGTITNVYGGYTDIFAIDATKATATRGDSGGPVLLTRTGEIVGVVSGGTVMARVDTHADLIEAARRDVARTPAATDSLDGRRGGSSRDRGERRGDGRSGVDCLCDTSDACDLDEEGGPCACDGACDDDTGLDEGGGAAVGCACDATWSCDADCSCDPECTDDAAPGDGSDQGEGGCACDATWECDADLDGWDCGCDPECAGTPPDETDEAGCACDATWDCDPDDDGWDCACDPEC